MARNRDELGASLTEKQKETLEKFEDCMNEMHSITERDGKFKIIPHQTSLTSTGFLYNGSKFH
jgi:hypothetical protein